MNCFTAWTRQSHCTTNKMPFRNEITEFLGHFVDSEWITVNDDNMKKIRDAKRPTTKKEVRSFMGLANYYRDFIPSFMAIQPSTDLTRKKQPTRVHWGDSQERASDSAKKLMERPILRPPDYSKPFVLRTDASNCRLSCLDARAWWLHPVA